MINLLLLNNMKKNASFLLCCLLLYACSAGKQKQTAYEFTNVRRGTIERTVSSSGTINPVSTVKVLPQMSGKVEKIFVDYNDPIRKGDILAQLNTDVLKLRREQQYAVVVKARANYELQRISYRNQEALAEKDLISEYELKTGKTTLDSQAADLAVAESNLKVIETEMNQYAYIKSPINGIVLDRKINIGDTVVDSSSNNSSAIFTLAENLREMQIEAAVGELDITSIHKGQQVRFTLESMPGRNFSGEVETLRMVPVMTNGVVSYTVIVKVENLDGSLLPGMTCAVDFIVERGENILMVPNAALRYQPTGLSEEKIADMVFNAGLANMDDEQKQAAIEARNLAKAQQVQNPGQGQGPGQNSGNGLQNLMMGGQGFRMPGERRGRGQGPGAEAGEGRREQVVMRNLWYLDDEGKLEVMRVRAGISSGSFTEVRSREDIEGRQIILREKI